MLNSENINWKIKMIVRNKPYITENLNKCISQIIYRWKVRIL